MRTCGLIRLTVALLLIATVPGHAQPPSTQDCAPQKLPKQLPTVDSPDARLAAEVLVGCWKQGQVRTRATRNQLRARSVVARSVNPGLSTMVVLEIATLEITDATLSTTSRDGGRTEFRIGSGELSGRVVLEANSLSGKLFGQLPVTIGAVLPVPLPYVMLTDVTVEDVTLTARTAKLHSITG